MGQFLQDGENEEKTLQEGSIPTLKIAKNRQLRVKQTKISSEQLRKSNRSITVKLQKRLRHILLHLSRSTETDIYVHCTLRDGRR